MPIHLLISLWYICHVIANVNKPDIYLWHIIGDLLGYLLYIWTNFVCGSVYWHPVSFDNHYRCVRAVYLIIEVIFFVHLYMHSSYISHYHYILLVLNYFGGSWLDNRRSSAKISRSRMTDFVQHMILLIIVYVQCAWLLLAAHTRSTCVIRRVKWRLREWRHISLTSEPSGRAIVTLLRGTVHKQKVAITGVLTLQRYFTNPMVRYYYTINISHI